MTISEQLIEALSASELSQEARSKVRQDIENYDRPYYDGIRVPTVLSVSSYGNVNMTSMTRFLNDPWSAKEAFKGNGKGYLYYVVAHGGLTPVLEEEACIALYSTAKDAGMPVIPDFNNVSGFMVSFEELRGSIPEHMREAFEYKHFDENTCEWIQPHVVKLREWYEHERDTILGYLRCDKKRVQLKDKDDSEHSEWVDVPVTKIGFGFNRFEQVSENARQSTAFFSVNDNSPNFTPEVTFNWHLQDTSRWLYAGAIAINYYSDAEEPMKKISISTHH